MSEISQNNPPTDSASQGFDIRTLLHILLEKSWLITVCFIVVTFLTGAYIMRSPKIFASTVVLQVEQEEQKVVKFERVQSEDLRTLEILKTYEQTLQSRALYERVIETNNLAKNPYFVNKETGQPLSIEDMAEVFSRIVKVRLRRGTRLIDVTVEHQSPELAARIANSLVEQFMRASVEQSQGTTKIANQFLEEEAQRLKKKLQDSENALQSYREKAQSVSLEDKNNTIRQGLLELSQRVTEARSTRIKLEADFAQVKKVGTNIDALLSIPSVAADASVANIRLNLSKLEADLAALKQRYKEKHPDYIQAVIAIAEWRKSLEEAVLNVPLSLRTSYESTKASEEAFERALKEQEVLAQSLGKQAIQYGVLSREVEADRLLFDNVMGRLKETSMAVTAPENKIRIVSPAYVPQLPIKPQKLKILVLGLMAGLVLGVGLALFMNSMDSSLKSVDQTEEFVGLPVLSVVPQMKEIEDNASQVVVLEDAKSSAAEAFRTLRTSLSMLGREEQRRVFLFTSALPAEGKTFCSTNYAASLAQSGLKTLLIDGDLRRPAVEKALGRSKPGQTAGVTDLLTGKSKFTDVVQTTEIENFHFISAGSIAPNPAELLAQTGFDSLVDEALQHYERIVIDSAPVHAVSDTLVMLNRVQTICVVARACKTPRKAVQRAVQILNSGKVPVAGIVLNRLPRRAGLEYYYNPYYDYSYRGKYGQKGVYGQA